MKVNEEVCTGGGMAYQYCVHLSTDDMGCHCSHGHDVIYNSGSNTCDDKKKLDPAKKL